MLWWWWLLCVTNASILLWWKDFSEKFTSTFCRMVDFFQIFALSILTLLSIPFRSVPFCSTRFPSVPFPTVPFRFVPFCFVFLSKFHQCLKQSFGLFGPKMEICWQFISIHYSHSTFVENYYIHVILDTKSFHFNLSIYNNLCSYNWNHSPKAEGSSM